MYFEAEYFKTRKGILSYGTYENDKNVASALMSAEIYILYS